MRRSTVLKSLWYLNALVLASLVVYKIYLNFFERDFGGVHARQVEVIDAQLETRNKYSFAVVGNINNSIGIFERKIIPQLNRANIDFVVSTGNAVSSGGEDKYRAVYRTLQRLDMPYLLTVGENEYSMMGGYRFYNHFGPQLYAFTAGNSRFLFLDSTGHTSYEWQLRWLEDELTNGSQVHTFVFSSLALLQEANEDTDEFEDSDFSDELRGQFADLTERAKVDAVFSGEAPIYSRQQQGNTQFVVTGGAGGFLLNDEDSYHHYVRVDVGSDGVSIAPVALDISQHALFRTLESLWFFVHSLFYVGYLNFALLICGLLLIASLLHSRLLADRDYYPDAAIDRHTEPDHSLRVAMFTNNYLPYVGGVPISIERLRLTLSALRHRVLIAAPDYGQSDRGEDSVLRIPDLIPWKHKSEFKLANIFWPRLYRTCIRFRPDVIHVHHPFWLGRAGLWLARYLNVPVIYTYHTRLEHFAHYVPLPGQLFRNFIAHAVIRHFSNQCDALIVPTNSAEEYLRAVGVRRPIFVQPTGVDTLRFSIREHATKTDLRTRLGIRGEKVLLTVSRLSKEKNIDFLIEAIAILNDQSTVPFKLVVVGDGQERGRLTTRIDALGLAESIRFVGDVPQGELPAYYALADVFVFASCSETQGMVIMEAMAAGLPIVAIRSSGINDFVRSGFNGYITPPDRELWAERVEMLLGNADLRSELGTNGAETVQSYDLEAFGRAVAAIYAYVLKARRHRAAATTGSQSKWSMKA